MPEPYTPSVEPDTDPALTSPTCDWGGCEYASKFWRFDPEHGWLPVCFAHSEKGEQFYRGLNADYQNTRGGFA
jgi:hypothetical protein